MEINNFINGIEQKTFVPYLTDDDAITSAQVAAGRVGQLDRGSIVYFDVLNKLSRSLQVSTQTVQTTVDTPSKEFDSRPFKIGFEFLISFDPFGPLPDLKKRALIYKRATVFFNATKRYDKLVQWARNKTVLTLYGLEKIYKNMIITGCNNFNDGTYNMNTTYKGTLVFNEVKGQKQKLSLVRTNMDEDYSNDSIVSQVANAG